MLGFGLCFYPVKISLSVVLLFLSGDLILGFFFCYFLLLPRPVSAFDTVIRTEPLMACFASTPPS